MLHFSGVTFSLRGDSIPTDDSGHVLITVSGLSGTGDWYLHPSQLTADDDYRLQSNDVSGWSRNKGPDSEGHQPVRLRRVSSTAEEGVFTCDIPGNGDTPGGRGIYYPCELYYYSITTSKKYCTL